MDLHQLVPERPALAQAKDAHWSNLCGRSLCSLFTYLPTPLETAALLKALSPFVSPCAFGPASLRAKAFFALFSETTVIGVQTLARGCVPATLDQVSRGEVA